MRRSRHHVTKAEWEWSSVEAQVIAMERQVCELCEDDEPVDNEGGICENPFCPVRSPREK
jgi:hypothetical protein